MAAVGIGELIGGGNEDERVRAAKHVIGGQYPVYAEALKCE